MIVRAEISVREPQSYESPKRCDGFDSPVGHETRRKAFQEELEHETIETIGRLADRFRVRVREIRFAEGRPTARKEKTTSE